MIPGGPRYSLSKHWSFQGLQRGWLYVYVYLENALGASHNVAKHGMIQSLSIGLKEHGAFPLLVSIRLDSLDEKCLRLSFKLKLRHFFFV
jgi:hypothetical protein